MASQTTPPARIRAPILGTPVPIAIGGLLAAPIVGILLARGVGHGVGVLLGFLYAPVILLNLSLGVALYVPLAFVERLPAASLGPTAVGILVVLAWLGTLPGRRSWVAAALRRTPGLFILLALLLAWVTMSISWAVDPSAAANEFWRWFEVAALFLIVATSFSERRYLLMLYVAFVAGALISVVAGLLPGAAASTTTLPTEAGRFTGSYGDPNFLALGLVSAIALTVGLSAVYRDSGRRTLLLFSGAVLVVGLAATGSRGGVVAAAVSGLTALLVARGRRFAIVAMFATALAVGGLWLATSSPGSLSRVREFNTGAGRTDLWTIAWRMSKANPVGGVGLNGYFKESPKYIRQPGRLPSGGHFTLSILDQPLVAHNTYLQMLAETGAVGLGLLVAVILAAMRATWMASRSFERLRDPALASLARATLIAQIGALSAATFISDYYDKRVWILLALGPALLAVAWRAERGGLQT
jgi:O-antigen ligase